MTEATKKISFALVPFRKNERLLSSIDYHDEMLMSTTRSCCPTVRRRRSPFIVVDSDDDSNAVLGRMDFLHAMWEACLRNHDCSNYTEWGDDSMECSCRDCKVVTAWAKKGLSRQMFHVKAVNETHVILELQKCKYPLACIQVVTTTTNIHTTNENGGEKTLLPCNSSGCEEEEDAGATWDVGPGCILQFRKHPNDVDPILEFQVVAWSQPSPSGLDKSTSQQEDVASRQLETQRMITMASNQSSSGLNNIQKQAESSRMETRQRMIPTVTLQSGEVHAIPMHKGNDFARKSSSPKRQRRNSNSSDPRLALGTFPSGASIYRNRLHPGETFENGHVAIDNLVLPECASALLTTFVGPSSTWLESILNGVNNVIVVRGDGDGLQSRRPRVVGDAELISIDTTDHRRSWFWLMATPHTGGVLHAKMMLFRNSHGLRVVVCGSNLYQEQWEVDRDTLWVQDFNAVAFDDGSSSSLGNELRSFLNDLTKCREAGHQALVQQLLKSIFSGISFSTASAKLVFSFPVPKAAKGSNKSGWRQLARCVRDLLDDVNNNSGDDDGGGNSILYAMAGSFGNVQPEFVLQMHQAMCGVDTVGKGKSGWDQVEGLVRCLWPSRQTALTMNLHAFIDHARAIPIDHWKKIPESAKRSMFFDALPNPKEMGLPQMSCHPLSHSKVLIKTGGNVGVLYVGSHNFSAAAWGLRGKMPNNIEMGVVLASASSDLRQEWRDRLPCLLPHESAKAPISYIPASAHQGIRELFAGGNIEQAIQMLRDWLNSDVDC